jgi:hypothetical protein
MLLLILNEDFVGLTNAETVRKVEIEGQDQEAMREEDALRKLLSS